ncbi:MAG: hypothetical protein ACFB4I_02880 [Cyanophyceae cyanobacterium]
MPTTAQAIKAVILCQYLSNGYQPIELFRYNPILKQIYVIAGTTESIELIVYENGDWEFIFE